MNENPSYKLNRRTFLGRTATLAAAGIGVALPATRVLSAENEDKAKALNLKITGLKTFLVDTGPASDENFVFVKIQTNDYVQPDIIHCGGITEVKKYPYQPKPWTSLRFPDGAIHDR